MENNNLIDENTALLHNNHQSTSPPPTPQHTPQTSIQTNSNSYSSCKIYFFLFILLVSNILLGLGGFYYYQILIQTINTQQQQLNSLQSNYNTLQNDYNTNKQTFQHFKNFTMSHLETITNNFNQRLQVLENMESNNDVIDELHSTEQALYQELEAEKTLINIVLNGLQENVTNSISQSNRLVDKKLTEVDKKIKNSESKMYSLVEETSRNVSNSVEMAERHIQIIDFNLTTQMNTMTSSVSLAIHSVKDMVESAKKNINDEVQAVHESMDQYIIVTNKQFAAENNFIKYQLAGTFSLLACLICLWHITSHARHITNPEVQKRIMAILWMVPIYSVTSWLSLVLPVAQPYLSAFRDCYEAYVVSTFLAFLRIALETDEDGKHQDVIEVLAKRVKIPLSSLPSKQSQNSNTNTNTDTNTENKNEISTESTTTPLLNYHHKTSTEVIDRSTTQDIESGESSENNSLKAPCPCCIPAQEKKSAVGIASSTLHQCEVMAMQFVYIKILLAITPFILKLCGYDYEGKSPISNHSIDWLSAKLYILLIGNLSVSMAFYGLLCFFHISEKDLAWCKPWPKFLCVKGVVFMTFWQDILLQCMSGYGMVDSDAASQIQNLLICIEMFMASIAHFYIFPYEEWDLKKRKQPKIQVNDTMALYAFLSDSRRVFRGNGNGNENENKTLNEGCNSMNQTSSTEDLTTINPNDINEQELEFIVQRAVNSYTPDKGYLNPLIELSNHSPKKIQNLIHNHESNELLTTPSEERKREVNEKEQMKEQEEEKKDYHFVSPPMTPNDSTIVITTITTKENHKNNNKSKKKNQSLSSNVILHDSDEELDFEEEKIESV